jgi:hypothetical protein
VAGVCGFPDDTAIVAIVYLGHPTGTVETPVRPPAGVCRISA